MMTRTLRATAAALVVLAFTATGARAEDPAPTDTSPVIQWRTELLAAAKESLADNKPLVVVYVCPLGRQACVSCKRLRGALFSPELQALADDAVFLMVEFDITEKKSPEQDATLLATRFEVVRTPTILVFGTADQKLEHRARLNGYFAAKPLAGHLEKYLNQK